jgi:hypothetical protein
VRIAVSAVLAITTFGAVIAGRAGQPWTAAAVGGRRSAVGSIGNTISRPFGQEAGADQLVVDPLLLLVQIRVQHVVGLLFLGEDGDGVPVVTYRFEHCAASTRLVEDQVIGKVKVGDRAPSGGASAVRDGVALRRRSSRAGETDLPFLSGAVRLPRGPLPTLPG